MKPMSAVIKHLKLFDRKERFILLSKLLGMETFRLDPGFAESLEQLLNVPVPDDAFVAMDYHLDWLQMALYLADKGLTPDPVPNIDKSLFRANQRDVDLLIAFADKDGPKTRLVLVEAKADTSWANHQLLRKTDRLELIFRKNRPGVDLVSPHFVLLSPKKPERINHSMWPHWMKQNGAPLWLELPLPEGFRKVTRCHEDNTVSEKGDYLRVVDIGRDGRVIDTAC